MIFLKHAGDRTVQLTFSGKLGRYELYEVPQQFAAVEDYYDAADDVDDAEHLFVDFGAEKRNKCRNRQEP